MLITLEEVKTWLRVDGSEDDLLIQSLISAAETYLYNATGNTFDSTNDLAKLFCMVLVTDWYENREAVGKTTEKTRPVVESMLTQLSHCYAPVEVVT